MSEYAAKMCAPGEVMASIHAALFIQSFKQFIYLSV